MSFKKLKFPETLKISSNGEMIPLDFFGTIFPLSKKAQFKLGYFSTNSIRTLCYGFAQFIFNGGSIDFLINHFVSEEDYNLINNEIEIDEEFYKIVESEILGDLNNLRDVLTKNEVNHFYNCLRYLLDHDRINIIPVTTKKGEISHYKEALFWDNDDSILNIVGSCNFTQNGLIHNGESFLINRSWGSSAEVANINSEIADYKLIFSKKSKDFIYLDPKRLINIVRDKSESQSEEQLLREEFSLLEVEDYFRPNKVQKKLRAEFEKIVDKLKNIPKFPFGKPRDYQKKAYENWVENGYKGLFAMATGTGKTITSLNCVLEEYKKASCYKFVVLVPSITLAEQWLEEITNKFNFTNSYICSSKNSNWENELKNLSKSILLGKNVNYGIVLTYATFKTNRFQKLLMSNFSSDFDKIILIADECHTFGSSGLLKVLPHFITKRIGLSATPERQYDEESDEILNRFFDTHAPHYTYSYNMKEAIDNGFLCKYYYHPRFVELDRDELGEYIIISEKLLKFIDSKTGKYKDDPIVNNLLIRRKHIIHKARLKLPCLVEIIKEIGKENFKNAFIYVPEGISPDYETTDNYAAIHDDLSEKLIIKYSETLYEKFKLRLRKFVGDTKDRDEIISQFKENKLDALLAMKCLDEGIDIPQTEIAIFCSSTGNPRQYIQRRGRVLRMSENKEFATIYDIVVKPSFDPTYTDEKLMSFEKNIFKSELKRVVNFLILSENKIETLLELESLANYCGENIYELATKEYENFE